MLVQVGPIGHEVLPVPDAVRQELAAAFEFKAVFEILGLSSCLPGTSLVQLRKSSASLPGVCANR